MDVISEIKRSVSAVRAAEALGLNPNRHGRCRCVWHEDKNPSMKLYEGDRGCYCFACHNGGSVIDLTMQALNTDMSAAIDWLDGTFQLHLRESEQTDTDTRKAAQKAAEARRIARERAERDRDAALDVWLDAQEVSGMIDRAVIANRPVKAGDGFSEAFRTAVFTKEEMRELNEDLFDALMCADERSKR